MNKARRLRGPALVRALEATRHTFGGEAAARKQSLLEAAMRTAMPSATWVRRLHEIACFLRAYPDDLQVAGAAGALLDRFGVRADLRRHRNALADSGIAGTDLHDRFFWFTAEWLAQRWPRQLAIDWARFDNRKDLEPLLRLLMPAAESAALDDVEYTPRQWIERWRGPDVTDATFLIRRFAALRADDFTTEMLYERLDPPLVLSRIGVADAAASSASPSRSTALAPHSPVVPRTRSFSKERPDLRQAARRLPLAIRNVGEREAQALLELARGAMITRNRDLDSFEHADVHDFRAVDCGDGLVFICMGLIPARRALLDAIYGYLTLQNGVPIGYVLTTALFESAFVAYNVFETFRGGEAAANYACVMATTRVMFGASSFAIDPYQLGHDNREGQKSGAWWFYYKLGFRPADAAVEQTAANELRQLARNRQHRSSPSTLQKLSAAPLFFHLGRERADVLGRVGLGNVSLHISQALARGGADREETIDRAIGRTARLLGVRPPAAGSGGRRVAWERWAPLALLLPGVERWSAGDHAALADVIDAKGGRRESDFVQRFDAHRRLRRAILQLSRRPPVETHRASG